MVRALFSMGATRRRSRCWDGIDRWPASSISIRRVESVHRPSLSDDLIFFPLFSTPWSQVAHHRAAIYSRHFTSKRQLLEINDNLLTSRLLARYAREKWNKNTITVSRERLTFRCFNLTIWWQRSVAIFEKRSRLGWCTAVLLNLI